MAAKRASYIGAGRVNIKRMRNETSTHRLPRPLPYAHASCGLVNRDVADHGDEVGVAVVQAGRAAERLQAQTKTNDSARLCSQVDTNMS